MNEIIASFVRAASHSLCPKRNVGRCQHNMIFARVVCVWLSTGEASVSFRFTHAHRTWVLCYARSTPVSLERERLFFGGATSQQRQRGGLAPSSCQQYRIAHFIAYYILYCNAAHISTDNRPCAVTTKAVVWETEHSEETEKKCRIVLCKTCDDKMIAFFMYLLFMVRYYYYFFIILLSQCWSYWNCAQMHRPIDR